MTESSNIASFPQLDAKAWIDGYQQDCLMQKDEATVDAYLRILRQFTAWVAERPGHSRHFAPSQLTTTVVELYLSSLKEQGYSVSHRTRVKTVINGFCQWLIEEKQVLTRNLRPGILGRMSCERCGASAGGTHPCGSEDWLAPCWAQGGEVP